MKVWLYEILRLEAHQHQALYNTNQLNTLNLSNTLHYSYCNQGISKADDLSAITVDLSQLTAVYHPTTRVLKKFAPVHQDFKMHGIMDVKCKLSSTTVQCYLFLVSYNVLLSACFVSNNKVYAGCRPNCCSMWYV